jgi:hypothetical protein
MGVQSYIRPVCAGIFPARPLAQEFTLMRALGAKLESGGGKADLFHLNLTHEAIHWGTFADHP